MKFADFGLKFGFCTPPSQFDWKCYCYLRKVLFVDYPAALAKIRAKYHTIHLADDGSRHIRQLIREHGPQDYGAYCEAGQVYLFGQSNRAMKKAFDTFCQWARRCEPEFDLPTEGIIFCETLDNADSVWSEVASLLPSACKTVRVYHAGDGCLQQCYRAGNSASYFSGRARLEHGGWSPVWENSLSGNLFCEYRKEGKSAFLSYISCQGTLQVTTGKATPWIDLPAKPAICEPLLVQPWVRTGMCEILRLPDGRFILIDGGLPDCAEHMIDEMRRIDVRGEEKIEVAAWIITHAHVDHYGVLKEVAAKYADKLRVTQFIYNIPDDSETVFCENRDTSMRAVMEAALPALGNPPVCKIHAGAVLEIGAAKLEFLNTHEDRNTPYHEQMNDTCSVCRLTLGGKRILITGDMYPDGARLVEAMYGDSLGCDVLQVPHHGYRNAATASFFAECRPTVALIPMHGTVQKQESICETVARLQQGGAGKIEVTREDETAIEIPL